MKSHLSFSEIDEPSALPKILRFPSGSPAFLTNNDTPKVDLVRTPKKRRVDISIDSKAVRYLSPRLSAKQKQILSGPSPPSQSPDFKYAIGIIDRKKAQISFIPVGETLDMTRFIKRTLATDLDTVENVSFQSQSYFDKRTALLGEFGSKKAKRIQRLGSLNRIGSLESTSKVTKAALSMASKQEVLVGPTDEEKAEQLLPRFHRTTSDASKIYNLNDCMPVQALDVLQYDALLWCLTEGSGIPRHYPEIVKEYVKNAKMSEKDALAVVPLLEYVSLLVRLSNVPQNCHTIEMLARRLRCESEHLDELIGHFVNPNNITLSNTCKTKVRCHLCVLVLLLFGLKVSKGALAALARDLKLSDTLMANHFKQVGCSLRNTKQKDGVAVVLKAPLQFPSIESKNLKTL